MMPVSREESDPLNMPPWADGIQQSPSSTQVSECLMIVYVFWVLPGGLGQDFTLPMQGPGSIPGQGTSSYVLIVDLPGGSVVKRLPANAGGAGSIPGQGRSHRLQRTKPMSHNL